MPYAAAVSSSLSASEQIDVICIPQVAKRSSCNEDVCRLENLTGTPAAIVPQFVGFIVHLICFMLVGVIQIAEHTASHPRSL